MKKIANGGLNAMMTRPVGDGKVPAIAANTIGTRGAPPVQSPAKQNVGTSRK